MAIEERILASHSLQRIQEQKDQALDHLKRIFAEIRRIVVTPHVAQNIARSSGFAIDGRTSRHEGYATTWGREGVWLDQTVGRSAPVQAAWCRLSEGGVWPARNRQRPDRARQPAHTGNSDGMSSGLSRCVARQPLLGTPSGENSFSRTDQPTEMLTTNPNGTRSALRQGKRGFAGSFCANS